MGLDADAAGVRVVGALDRFWIPVSDFAVTPVVALAPERPELVAAPAEVAQHRGAAAGPVPARCPARRSSSGTIGDWPLRYGDYEVDGLSVWGATARVLSQLGGSHRGRPRG